MSDRSRESPAARSHAPRRIRIDGLRGTSYGELAPEELGHLAGWLRAGSVPDAEVLKAGRVYALDDRVVKLFDFGGSLRDHLRPSPAVRSARVHRALADVGVPRPLATLEEPHGRSLLLMERIDGGFLHDVLARGDERALEAFPRFMAELHLRRVYHGDLHTLQILWNGARWYLLDLDGLRHPLRKLRRRRLVEAQWVRLHYSLERDARVEDLFRRYLALAWPRWEPEAAWGSIVEGEAQYRAARGSPRG